MAIDERAGLFGRHSTKILENILDIQMPMIYVVLTGAVEIVVNTDGKERVIATRTNRNGYDGGATATRLSEVMLNRLTGARSKRPDPPNGSGFESFRFLDSTPSAESLHVPRRSRSIVAREASTTQNAACRS
jgi:hypothetical protein